MCALICICMHINAHTYTFFVLTTLYKADTVIIFSKTEIQAFRLNNFPASIRGRRWHFNSACLTLSPVFTSLDYVLPLTCHYPQLFSETASPHPSYRAETALAIEMVFFVAVPSADTDSFADLFMALNRRTLPPGP